MPNDLINTVEAPGEFDALTKLRPGEPYFPLVGRDRLAPPLIDHWADKNRRRALAEYDAGNIDKETRERELRKSTQAEMIAASMIEYKNNWKVKTETSAARPTYSGHELPEQTQKTDKLQSLRARAAQAVRGAAAEVNDLLEFISENGMMEDTVAHIRFSLQDLIGLAEHIEPPRKGISR